MSIQVKCANGHAMAVPDKYQGKKVRCPKCQAIIAVGAEQESTNEQVLAKPPPLPAGGMRAQSNDVDRPRAQRRPADDDDFVDEDEQPRARRRRDEKDDVVNEDEEPRARRRRDEKDDVDDEDDRPRSRRRRDEEDDFEDEDDRPRSRRRRDEEDDFDDEDDRPRSRKRRADDDDWDDDDDRPRSGRRRDEDDDWGDDEGLKRGKKKESKKAQLRATATGLMLYYARFLCLAIAQATFIGVILLLVIGGLMLRAQVVADPRNAPDFAITLLGIGGILTLVAGVIALAGPILGVIAAIFCMRSPTKARAFGLGITALIMDAGILLGLVLYVATIGAALANPFNAPLGMLLVVMLLMAVCSIAGFIVIMIMISFIARYLKDHGAADQTISAMILYLAVTIGGAIGILLLGLVLRNAGTAGAVIGGLVQLGWMVASTIILFGIAMLIRQIRGNI